MGYTRRCIYNTIIVPLRQVFSRASVFNAKTSSSDPEVLRKFSPDENLQMQLYQDTYIAQLI